MWIEKNRKIGREFNPFTGHKEDVYNMDKSKEWFHYDYSKKRIKSTNQVAICSGNIIEIKQYESPVFYNFEGNSKGKSGGSKQKRANNINQSKMKLRRLINSNIKPYSKFITLTFADNVTDMKKAKIEFKNFVKRLNYKLKKKGSKNLKYVYVVEFQKRGAIHFHVIGFNLGFIKNSDLREMWKHGYVTINKINNVDNVGAYVVKYMSKDLVNEGLNGHDLYGRSRGNLEEPIEIKNPQEVGQLLESYENKIVYSKTYNTEYFGECQYIQINLTRSKTL